MTKQRAIDERFAGHLTGDPAQQKPPGPGFFVIASAAVVVWICLQHNLWHSPLGKFAWRDPCSMQPNALRQCDCPAVITVIAEPRPHNVDEPAGECAGGLDVSLVFGALMASLATRQALVELA